MDMKKSYGKSEFRLGERSIPLPLSWESLYKYSGLIDFKGKRFELKILGLEEIKWAEFLLDEAEAYARWCLDKIATIEKVEENLSEEKKETASAARYFLEYQRVCAALLVERCGFALGEKQKSLKRITDLSVELSKTQNENGYLSGKVKGLTTLYEKAQAENEALKARVAELESTPQKAAAGVKKAVDERERKTFLKLIHAALSLERRFSPSNSSLAGLLAAKTQELYPAKPVDNDTIKKKLNEIIALHKDFSE